MPAKYNFTQRKQLRAAITKNHNDGVTDSVQLTKALINQGFKGPGGVELQTGTVRSQVYAMAKAGYAKRGEAKSLKPKPTVISELQALRHLVLDTPGIPAENKIKIMRLID